MTTSFEVIAKLYDALTRQRWTPRMIDKLASTDRLTQYRNVELGRARIVTIDHPLDLDADPPHEIPRGFVCTANRKGGQIQWTASKTALYVPAGLTHQGCVVQYTVEKLRAELKGQRLYNCLLLKFLQENPNLIEEQWWGKTILALGTEYTLSGEHVFVCALVISSNPMLERPYIRMVPVGRPICDEKHRVAVMA